MADRSSAGHARHVPRAAFAAALTLVTFAATVATSTAAQAAEPRGDSPMRIAVTEQASDQILVLESDHEAWDSATIAWKWKPSAANGLGDLVDNWGLPDEAKVRYRGDQAYLLTTDSYGLAAVIPYPQGTPAYWATDVGKPNNPHSIELLPNGNVAVAASTGGFLRVYAASQGPRATAYTQFDLSGAHGAYWDSDHGWLWTIGNYELVALTVGGTAAKPTLTVARRETLPTPGGHDLQPVASRPNRLWLTTGSAVYQYDIEARAFVQDFPDAERISVPGVKTIGDEKTSGQILTTMVQPGNLCTWCTDTVMLFARDDTLTLHGAQIYKTRWWVDPNHPGRRP